eukprot:3917360-Alexandrium_andersonii.AAC.1
MGRSSTRTSCGKLTCSRSRGGGVHNRRHSRPGQWEGPHLARDQRSLRANPSLRASGRSSGRHGTVSMS